jgi:hypothetical protein
MLRPFANIVKENENQLERMLIDHKNRGKLLYKTIGGHNEKDWK